MFTSVHTLSLLGAPQYSQLNFKRHSVLRTLEIKLAERSHLEGVSGWLSETLSTITSKLFTKLTISIAPAPFMFRDATENESCEWNSVDNALDRFNLCEDVTLVVRSLDWVVADHQFKEAVGNHFPLMWETGRVVFEVLPPDTECMMSRRRCRR